MGALIYRAFALGLCAQAVAGAAPVDRKPSLDAIVVVPSGDPLPGESTTLLVAVHRDGVPVQDVAPGLKVDRGEVAASGEQVSPGRWRYGFRAPWDSTAPVGIRLDLEGRVVRTSIPLAREQAPSLDGPSHISGGAGRSQPLSIRVTGAGIPEPDDLQVVVPEGEIVDIRQGDDDLIIRFKPSSTPFPRAIPIGFRDARRPGVQPTWTVARLRGTLTIPVKTEPGTKVVLRVRGRSYGPFVADSRGNTRVRADVRSGETVADVELTDGLGNVQRSKMMLGGSTAEVMVGMADGGWMLGSRAPSVYLFAVSPNGRPWRGDAPTCALSTGEAVGVVPIGPGRWRAALSNQQEPIESKMNCTVGRQGRASVRIPVLEAVPSRIVIRSHPDQLSADLPIAEVQAFVVNALGDRLRVEGVELTADQGAIELEPAGGGALVRGSYNGERAAVAGGDTIRARWSPQAGTGQPWTLRVAAPAPGTAETVVVDGQAVDQRGRPLSGVDLRLSMGEGERAQSVTTGQRGWATAELRRPSGDGPWVIEARHGHIVRRALVFRDEGTARQRADADLAAALSVPIEAGQVRSVFLVTEPRTLHTGGETARVVVRLEDKSGQPVRDQAIELRASVGVISRPRQRADGSFEAVYAPPLDLAFGTVEITAASPDGAFATTTEVDVVPRRVRRAPGVHGGYLVGSRGVDSPWFGIDMDLRLPTPNLPLFARASIGVFGEAVNVVDEQTGTDVSVDIDVVPIGLGVLARQEGRGVAGWVGSTILLSPYRIETYFGDVLASRGWGLAPPGVSVFTGTGWRVRNGEFQVQLSYVFLSISTDEVGWQGPIGGVVGTVGYKLLY